MPDRIISKSAIFGLSKTQTRFLAHLRFPVKAQPIISGKQYEQHERLGKMCRHTFHHCGHSILHRDRPRPFRRFNPRGRRQAERILSKRQVRSDRHLRRSDPPGGRCYGRRSRRILQERIRLHRRSLLRSLRTHHSGHRPQERHRNHREEHRVRLPRSILLPRLRSPRHGLREEEVRTPRHRSRPRRRPLPSLSHRTPRRNGHRLHRNHPPHPRRCDRRSSCQAHRRGDRGSRSQAG